MRELMLTGALAKVGFEVGRPPNRAVWSTVFWAVMWATKVSPMGEREAAGRSGVVRSLMTHAVPDGAGVTMDWVPGARSVEAITVLPSSGRRRRVWYRVGTIPVWALPVGMVATGNWPMAMLPESRRF